MENLDRLAAEAAQQVIKETTQFKSSEVDNLATKALGVLQENGVYAATLFLCSRSGREKELAQAIQRALLGLSPHLLAGRKAPPEGKAEDPLGFVTRHVANDLDTLLLVKQVWEQALIYLRYGAKARGGEP